MPGFSASSPSSASAGGQDEQPWLVNSSTTAGGLSGLSAPCPANAKAASAARTLAQIGGRRLMALTMPDAGRNFREKRINPGHNSVRVTGGQRSVVSRQKQ